MSRRAGRRGKHRYKPRKYSSARVYGTLNGYTKWKQIHGRRRLAPKPSDWGIAA